MKRTLACFAVLVMVGGSALAQRPGTSGAVGRPSVAGRGVGVSARPTFRTSGPRLSSGAGLAHRDAAQRRRVARSQNASERAATNNHEVRPSEQPGKHRIALPSKVVNMTGLERAFQQRLAAIDRMRDFAVESNSLALLERADALEQLTRQHHERLLTSPDHTAALRPAHLGPDQSTLPEAGLRTHDAKNQPYGHIVSENARTLGREFGQFTAQQARELGRDFGNANATKTRLFQPPVDPEPAPTEPTGNDSVDSTVEIAN